MKILLLTQVLPYPPDSGPKVKTWNVLKYLAQHHEVTLVSFTRGDQSSEINTLKEYCSAVHAVPMKRGAVRDGWYMLRSIFTSQPFLMVRDDRHEMRQLIDKLAAETPFDIVHADQLNMAQYATRVPNARKILDAHNALWLLYQRLWKTMEQGPKKWLLNRDWQLIKQYEGQTCYDFDGILAVSEEDKIALEEAMQTVSIQNPKPVLQSPRPEGEGSEAEVSKTQNRFTVIPIAIDTDEVTPVFRKADAENILHIGTMFWPPNVDGILWFLNEVFPLIKESRPQITFDVVGAKPPPEIVAFNGNGSGVNVTGYVTDPMPYYEKTGVMIVPLRAGGGMRVKILNALAQELPMVSTTLGCEGIAAKDGQHMLIADTPQEFAQAVLRLLENKQLADTLGKNGRQLIQSTYDYREACKLIDDCYRQALDN